MFDERSMRAHPHVHEFMGAHHSRSDVGAEGYLEDTSCQITTGATSRGRARRHAPRTNTEAILATGH